MKRDIFCTWLVIAVAIGAVVFALLSLGGCGGSSSSYVVGSPDDSNLTMSDIWDDDEAMNEVFDRLTSEDAFKLLGVKMECIERKDDGSVRMQYFDAVRYVLSDEEYPEIPLQHGRAENPLRERSYYPHR